MSINSKYFDSIRIGSLKRLKKETIVPQCQWKNCKNPGKYPAPANNIQDRKYFYLCINHIRKYNKNFNCFSRIPDQDISKEHKDAMSSDETISKDSISRSYFRASQDFSYLRSGSSLYQNHFHDSLNSFSEKNSKHLKLRKIKNLEVKALVVLGLNLTSSKTKIKKRYKELVKLHHPDSNGGSRDSEDRLQKVLNAYNLLKRSGLC